MARITAAENPSVSEWGARMTVRLRNGREVAGQYTYVKGHPENPFGEQDFIDKFHLCVPYSAHPLDDETVSRLIGDILALERVDDVAATLLGPLTPSPV